MSHQEYVVARGDGQYFVTRDGSFWAPLPVLSVKDLKALEKEFGLLSAAPFSGDPGVVLIENLTELHRLSQLVYFLSYRALYPSGALE